MGRRGSWAARFGRVVLLGWVASSGVGEAVEVRYAASLLSQYVWRGITLTDDPVLQPSVSISHSSGVSFEAWGNVDLGDANDESGEISEVRLVVDYGHAFGRFELGGGLIEYLFPNTPYPGTREVYARAGFDALVSPRLELHYDIDEIEGGYARLTLAYRRQLGALWSLTVEASAGWADASFAIGGQAGFHDGDLELDLRRSAGAFELELSVGHTDTLDSDVLPDQPVKTWFGVRSAYRF